MKLDCPFAFFEFRPEKKRQTKIDGYRTQRIDRAAQIYPEGVAGVKIPGFCDERLSEISLDGQSLTWLALASVLRDTFRTEKKKDPMERILSHLLTGVKIR